MTGVLSWQVLWWCCTVVLTEERKPNCSAKKHCCVAPQCSLRRKPNCGAKKHWLLCWTTEQQCSSQSMRVGLNGLGCCTVVDPLAWAVSFEGSSWVVGARLLPWQLAWWWSCKVIPTWTVSWIELIRLVRRLYLIKFWLRNGVMIFLKQKREREREREKTNKKRLMG